MYIVIHVLITLSSSSLKETLWKKEVHDSSELRQVTCAVAYDIQGEHHLVCAYTCDFHGKVGGNS